MHKAASSAWMWLFTLLERGSPPTPGKPTYSVQHRMSPRTLAEWRVAASYSSVLLVRHPLERLVSAYRDRVAALRAPLSLYKKVALLLHLHRVDARLRVRVRPRRGKTGPVITSRAVAVPSWPEFVQFLLLTPPAEYDRHWALYSRQCSPCLANFTYVVELEREGEEEAVLRLTGLSQLAAARPRHATPGGPSGPLVQQFLGLLSCKQLAGLADRYWPDLTLFQYSMAEMLSWGNNGTGCAVSSLNTNSEPVVKMTRAGDE